MPEDYVPSCCGYCGWTYDPEKGYPRKGVEPGTPLEELPDRFNCPRCGGKTKWFEPCRSGNLAVM